MIGEKIKEVRKEKELTQRELAERLGTTPQNIAQYETGKRNPKRETLQKIAQALNVPLSDLIPDNEITVKRIEKDGTLSVIGTGWDVVQKVQDEQKENISRFTDNAPTGRYKKLLNRFNNLNFSGQDKAIEQVELLTKIPEYRKDN